ncbi:MAG: amidohydrolase [Candidatus Melainabacteria bacterium HGW-Melainabacteria-1]|nr:MAG: amidohydrolase [Candidatus Melainabacteria bacterium HGW-Melainabacteria-1]
MLTPVPDISLTRVVALRRTLHREAELSNQEHATAAILADWLAQYQPDQLFSNLGGHGLAAVYAGPEPGPTVLIRAELDALLIQEDLPIGHRSRHPGVSHKCGHDGHMAIVAGLAPGLKANPLARGRAVLLFQPAEETGEGALRVLQDPAFAAIRPDYCFALHNLPAFELGQVVLQAGTFALASVGLKIELLGHSSHAAYPERGCSPAGAMAELILALQALNQTPRSDFALLTVVSANLGETSFGINPGFATVMATLRSGDDEVLAQLRAEATELAQNLAQTAGLECRLSWHEAFPVTRNHPKAVALLEQASLNCGWQVMAPAEPFRWSEDFGWFTREIPGALFGLGAGHGLALHSEDYDFPEALLDPGIRIFRGVLDQLLA